MRLLVSTLCLPLNLCVSKDIRAYYKVFEDLNLDISSFPETLEIRYGNGLNFKTPGSILDPQLTDELRGLGENTTCQTNKLFSARLKRINEKSSVEKIYSKILLMFSLTFARTPAGFTDDEPPKKKIRKSCFHPPFKISTK